MMKAQPGHVVEMRCTTMQPDGTVIESTTDVGTVEARLGEGQLPEPIEQALIGMHPGDRKRVPVPALAERRDELVHQVRVEDLPENVSPEVGGHLEVRYADGKSRKASITDVADRVVTLDANHPLAGRALVFDIELVAVN